MGPALLSSISKKSIVVIILPSNTTSSNIHLQEIKLNNQTESMIAWETVWTQVMIALIYSNYIYILCNHNECNTITPSDVILIHLFYFYACISLALLCFFKVVLLMLHIHARSQVFKEWLVDGFFASIFKLWCVARRFLKRYQLFVYQPETLFGA